LGAWWVIKLGGCVAVTRIVFSGPLAYMVRSLTDYVN
jgi:hypothetical protein